MFPSARTPLYPTFVYPPDVPVVHTSRPYYEQPYPQVAWQADASSAVAHAPYAQQPMQAAGLGLRGAPHLPARPDTPAPMPPRSGHAWPSQRTPDRDALCHWLPQLSLHTPPARPQPAQGSIDPRMIFPKERTPPPPPPPPPRVRKRTADNDIPRQAADAAATAGTIVAPATPSPSPSPSNKRRRKTPVPYSP